MKIRTKILFFLCAIVAIAILSSAFEIGDDNYYCEIGDLAEVGDNNRWACINLTAEYCLTDGSNCALGGGSGGGKTGVSPLYNDTEFMYFNLTLQNESITNIHNSLGGGGGAGNCSSSGSCGNITYLNYSNQGGLNISDDLHVDGYYMATSLGFTLTDDGSNLEFTSNVAGNNYIGMGTDGAFWQLYANPNPGNDYLMFTVSETQGASTEINFYEGGTGHNRLWSSGSVRVGGDAGYLCSEITDRFPCNTPVDGADLIVEGGVFAGREMLSEGNITINTSNGIKIGGGFLTNNGTHWIWD